jgi:hypothetical protein
MTSIQEQLQKDRADIEWEALIPHSQRDSIIFVEDGLDLVEVGVAIAQDETAKVQVWIAEELIHKPTAQQLSLWNQSPSQLFDAVIVQPYVLIGAPHAQSRTLSGS